MKKYSKNEEYSYTLGTTITLELLKQKVDQVLRIYVHSKQVHNATFLKMQNICKKHHISIIYNDKIFKTLSDKENCYIIGVFKKYQSSIKQNTNHIVLVNPSNTGNLGTIIRTSVGFGIRDLAIISPAVDIYQPKVIRASMGAFFHINFAYFSSFEEYIDHNPQNNLYPFILQTNQSLHTTNPNKPYSLVFGNEATGLSESFKAIGTPIRIFHTNNIDSLNLDNAVSIALYEFTKNNYK